MDSNCWVWPGQLDENGYGRVFLKSKKRLISRIVLAAKLGRPIREGYCALHNCPGGDNPSCFNPDHLWEGTRNDNVQDMKTKKRQVTKENLEWRKKVSQPKPRQRGEGNGRAVVTEDMVKEIRRLHQEGWTEAELASLYPPKKSAIGNIIRRKSWDFVS